ncbi:MAG: NUDIX hydrolase [Clostridia bacterium]|jgi:predicted NUDIX family phosphoesterase|nr:NUDIX hydrolase [Clostridia bacterium]
MELFTYEVNDISELKEKLKNNREISKDYEVAVILCAFDKDNKIIFQRRGPGCRDERLKLETIGGRVKESDNDFRNALKREIIEEVGEEANIEIDEFIMATYGVTFDNRYNKQQAWVYLVYKGNLKTGQLEIKEPDKCLGYERYKIGEVDENELSNGAREIYRIVSRKYEYLR